MINIFLDHSGTLPSAKNLSSLGLQTMAHQVKRDWLVIYLWIRPFQKVQHVFTKSVYLIVTMILSFKRAMDVALGFGTKGYGQF